jgi:hypothetical protein
MAWPPSRGPAENENAIPMRIGMAFFRITAGAYAAPVWKLIAWRYRAPDDAMFCDNDFSQTSVGETRRNRRANRANNQWNINTAALCRVFVSKISQAAALARAS